MDSVSHEKGKEYMDTREAGRLSRRDLTSAARVLKEVVGNPDALARWRAELGDGHDGCPRDIEPFAKVQRRLRNLKTGQFVKVANEDPYGNELPEGVVRYDGEDPGYSVSVHLWGRTVQYTVPYRFFPGQEGIDLALDIKEGASGRWGRA